jgi:hypothetical protein
MWTFPIHLSGPACSVVAVLGVLGVSARPVFRYPHLWRYLGLRLNKKCCHRSTKREGVCNGTCRGGACPSRIDGSKCQVSSKPQLTDNGSSFPEIPRSEDRPPS